MQNIKNLYAKMVDYKHFGIVMLAASVFFYLGAVLPSAVNHYTDIIIMMAGNVIFLAGAVFFFLRSNNCRRKLLETEEGREYLNCR